MLIDPDKAEIMKLLDELCDATKAMRKSTALALITMQQFFHGKSKK